MMQDRTWHTTAIVRGVILLVIGTPLALASVPLWASSIMQMAVFALFVVWLHNVSSEATIIIGDGALLKLFGLFVAVIALQLLPMPMNLLEIVTPGTAAIYRSVEGDGSGPWHSISLYPQATLNELLNLLAYGAVFLVVSHAFRGREHMLLLARTIVTMGCLLVLVAVLQKAAWNGRIYGFYPIDPALESRSSNIWGPYINRNHFAGYLEMAVPLALGLLMYTLSRDRRERGKTALKRIFSLAVRRRLPAFALLVLAVVVMSGALFATLSRGGILGFAASMAAFILMMRSRRSLRSNMGVILFVAIFVAAVGLFAAWDRIEGRFTDLADENRIMRTQVWSDLTGLVRDFPLLGTGAGTFDRIFPRYQSKYSTVLFEHAENDYLEVLAETGFIGLSLAVATGAVFFVTTIGRWKARRNSLSTCIGVGGLASCTAIAVHSLTDFNLSIPANALLLAVIAGLTVAGLARADEEGNSTENSRKRSPAPVMPADGIAPGTRWP